MTSADFETKAMIFMAVIRYGKMSVGCTVLDLSEEGAALDVRTQVGIPDRFTLTGATQKRQAYSCTVVWRDKRRISVAFH